MFSAGRRAGRKRGEDVPEINIASRQMEWLLADRIQEGAEKVREKHFEPQMNADER